MLEYLLLIYTFTASDTASAQVKHAYPTQEACDTKAVALRVQPDQIAVCVLNDTADPAFPMTAKRPSP